MYTYRQIEKYQCAFSKEADVPKFCALFQNNALSSFLKTQSSPITGLEWPRGFQEFHVPIFRDNGT